jgi:hypothetical protein
MTTWRYDKVVGTSRPRITAVKGMRMWKPASPKTGSSTMSISSLP